MAEPKLIPWHHPQLRAALEPLLREMAMVKALEDPTHRAAFERFMQAATSAPPKQRRRRKS